MDYVRGELLRQQRLLAALMGGGSGAEENGEREAVRNAGAGEPLPELSPSGAAPWENISGGLRPEAEALRMRMPGAGRRGANLQTGPDSAFGGETWRRQGAGGALPAAMDRRTGGAAPGTPETSDREWLSVGRQRAQGGMDAQAVSRAIQRDARRYDGGFTIY